MFRIGEFSKIARVSGRLLRYYDQIGLFQPLSIDSESGYRFYSAQQLPRLNRILALKELGLTLDQIARLMSDDLPPDELRGMLTMKKAEIEQEMADELRRIRSIEMRLEQIDREGMLPEYDIVLKNIPPQSLLTIRDTLSDLPSALQLLGELVQALPAQVGHKSLGHFLLILHSEMFEVEDIDVEMGFILTGDFSGTATLSGERQMTVRQAPAVETMATYVATGSLDYSYIAYNAIGTWMETNRYRFAGPPREEILQMPSPNNLEEWVREVQLPVEKIDAEAALLL